jgi:hypothetical protein
MFHGVVRARADRAYRDPAVIRFGCAAEEKVAEDSR